MMQTQNLKKNQDSDPWQINRVPHVLDTKKYGILCAFALEPWPYKFYLVIPFIFFVQETELDRKVMLLAIWLHKES